MALIGLLPIYLDREEGGGSCGSPARPSLFYFEDPAFRTRKRRLGTRIGSVVSAVAGPSPSAEMALFFCLFTAAQNHEEAGITQKESGA
jgi:hypothetical protein